MEVDEIQTQQQGSKFPRIVTASRNNCQNGGDQNNNNNEDETETARGNLGISTLGRFCGWPASRIVRVSRASGGKDRHSKVWTSKGLRDRRVRLSVHTAIQFYDLQDRLGYDQPSKAVEWLLKAAAKSIDELPSINTSFPVTPEEMVGSADVADAGNQHSSNSENSNNGGGGGQLSLSRSENRIKARERAKERRAEKELVQSSFTELLTGGTGPSGQGPVSPMDYFPTMAQYNNHHHHQIQNQHQHEMQHQHFSLLPDHMMPVASTDLSFTMSSSSSSRGTLQSNSQQQQQTLLMPHQQHQNHFQRLSHLDGSSVPFFIGTAAPTSASIDNHHHHHNQFPTGLQLYYENVNGNGSHLDHKGKGKN